MNTKEKLDMLWKYLALVVVALLGSIMLHSSNITVTGLPGVSTGGKGHVFIRAHEGDFAEGDYLKEMKVRVEKEVIDGDTTLNVTVNGKPVEASNFEETGEGIKWVSEDGEVHVIKMGNGKFKGDFKEMEMWIDENNEDGKKQKKVIIKKMKKGL